MRATRSGVLRVEAILIFCAAVALGGLGVTVAQRTRADAHRTVCQDNLRQVGGAVLAYERLHGHIPPSALDARGMRRGWVTFILPHLGEEKLHGNFHADVDWFDPINAEVVATPLKVLQCPAAPARGLSSGEIGGVAWRGAVGDYVAVENLDGSVLSGLSLPEGFDRAGFFQDPELTRLADVTDGLATTLMLVEEAGQPQAWRKGKRLDVDLPEEQGTWASRRLKLQARGHNAEGTSFPGPCAVNCTNNRGVYGFHPGFAHACFADGSVRPLREGLNIHVFYAMVTIRGGEIIALDD